ncbi:DMT family transporter [Sediminibacillus albus]|uniref:Small multidrug resistance pump n=1 Tax=Sediminibacillus albus TaxID=407036 RepID=A0A1G8WTA4_9BACI|nr:multidrug efflux SMR transporter [Sediminibacillus albus]SDJ81619.1 small multidrug resistance pump [Sediminibacillus albus]
MAYLYLVSSLVLAFLSNLSVKMSGGFARPLPTIAAFISYALCLTCLTLSVQYFEVGLVYALWSGVTVSSTAIIGMLFFNETFNRLKILSLFVIITGVVLLHIETG